MSIARGPTDDMDSLRAVVFREDDLYVAQCLEQDISVQAPDLNTLIDRLELAVDAECALSMELTGKPFSGPAAPVYFHTLWEKGSLAITRHSVAVNGLKIEAKLAA
jgi:hypothetical protein